MAKRGLWAFVPAVTCLLALASSAFATPVLTAVGDGPGDCWTPAYFYEGAPLIGPASDHLGIFDTIQIEWVSETSSKCRH